MEVSRLLEILLHGNQLKRTTRTGWAQRGVPSPENVAAHSYGVVYTALLLAELVETPLDLAAVLAMAILHDLPESLTTDIPPAVWRLMPPGAKVTAEQSALEQIFDDAPFGPRLTAWWEELRRNETAEARLVHDADKLDQYIQATLYERQTGNRQLEEFWLIAHQFHYSPAQAVYEELRRQRGAAGQGGGGAGENNPPTADHR
jgi:putative hydrolase of HD superfamily